MSAYTIFSELSCKHGKSYPQVSQAQKHTWEQHCQQDSIDKENKGTSLRNDDCFEAWKRKQEHHPLLTPVSQVERKWRVEIQHCICSVCRQLEIQNSEKAKPSNNKPWVILLQISYFTGQQHLGDLRLFSRGICKSSCVFLDFWVIQQYSISKSSSSTTVLQLNIIFSSQYGLCNSFCTAKSVLHYSDFSTLAKNKNFFFPCHCFFLPCLEIL